jgi:hypothetical protein
VLENVALADIEGTAVMEIMAAKLSLSNAIELSQQTAISEGKDQCMSPQPYALEN